MRLSPPKTSVKQFYILALSQKNVRLFHCDLHNVLEVQLESTGMPGSLHEETDEVAHERQVQTHSSAHGSRGAQGISHGSSGGGSEPKTRIEEHFRAVSAALMEVLRNDRTPMILAAVEYLVPIFQRVSAYPVFTKEFVAGSPDRLTGWQLRDKALGIIKRETAKERYGLPG
jgi:hypothetical protein